RPQTYGLPLHDALPISGAWVTTIARRRAIDRLRRESARSDKQRQAVRSGAGAAWPDLDVGGETVEDDLLRLVFTCCHPALDQPADRKSTRLNSSHVKIS